MTLQITLDEYLAERDDVDRGVLMDLLCEAGWTPPAPRGGLLNLLDAPAPPAAELAIVIPAPAPAPEPLDMFVAPPAVAEPATAVKTILHLCADTGSDTWPYRSDPRYEVITIGADIGVENYHPDRPIHGVVANPVCTEFSAARYGNTFGGGAREAQNPEAGMELVRECLRVIEEAQPAWYAIENPATGRLRDFLGKPDFAYEPWQFGSPWTKRTALWGRFTPPTPAYTNWDDVPKLPIYARPGRRPSIAFLHKSAFQLIPEFRDSGMPTPTTDAELRSLCSQGFARAFKAANP